MKRSAGFTLVEISIAVAVVGVGLVLAGTNLQSWVYKYNYSGMGREIFMLTAQAKTMAGASQRQHRLVVDLSNNRAGVQRGNAATNSTVWTDVVQPVTAASGCNLTSVIRTTGGADNTVTAGTVNIVFNASGDAFPLDLARVRMAGSNGEQGQIRIYGWTSKARIENGWN